MYGRVAGHMQEPIYQTVHATHHQAPVLHLQLYSTVSLITKQPLAPYGTPVIPCGMACSVEEMRDHAVAMLNCSGLTS